MTLDSGAHQLVLDKWSFDVWTSQKCKYLFVNSYFQGRHHFTWRNISKFSEDFEGYGQGPSLFLTDYGACCTLIPHLDFETKDKNKSLSSIYHELKADSKSGDNFGLDIVLNAEDFNYGAFSSNYITKKEPKSEACLTGMTYPYFFGHNASS